MKPPGQDRVRAIKRIAKKVLGIEHLRPADPVNRRAFERLVASALFEEEIAEFHLARAGVPRAKLSEWYWSLPVAERPSFSPYFDAGFYLRRYRDVASAGSDPQMHFFLSGFREARSPHPLIDLEYMAHERSDLLNPAAGHDMLTAIIDADLMPTTPYIDMDHCRKVLANVRGESSVLRHILRKGLPDEGSLNPLLDPEFYARRYADAPDEPIAASIHFIEHGDHRARQSSEQFDAEWYFNAYPDLIAAGSAPLYHYLRNGRKEGRPIRRLVAVNVIQSSGGGVAGYEPPPERPDDILASYDALKASIAAERDKAVQAVAEADIRVASFPDALPFERLSLATSDAPELSILIPVYNAPRETFECLWSIMTNPPAVPYEVVLADDASPDAGMEAFAGVAGLRHVRQSENLGFLMNCNAAFPQTRGAFVLLLNSDTQVLPGALDALMGAVSGQPDIGAAGGMLLYPNGRVQEAGCVVHSDGGTEMAGLNLASDTPEFLRGRDVSYCSGAALLVRRASFEGDLFDPRFSPAYCEDVDLCLRIRASGWRVRYVPEARFVHHLSVSQRQDSERRRVQTAFTNQHRMLDKWGEEIERHAEVRTLAFYLPQFHPVPENDLWWGKGFTEWRNVAGARPKYDGHYQPHLPADLGYYDLRIPAVMGEQYRLARRYGIEGFCVYRYNFSGRPILSAPLDNLVRAPEIDFPFCVCWANENWTKHWDGGDRALLLAQDYTPEHMRDVARDAADLARDPRYIKVDGKPLFLVYRPLLIPDPRQFAAIARQTFRDAGHEAVHLVYVESMEAVEAAATPGSIGFDACVEFPPHGIGVLNMEPTASLGTAWRGNRYDYAETVRSAASRAGVSYVRYPAVFPSWDNTPRQPVRGTSFDGATPERFQAYCEAKIAEAKALHYGDERLLFVNAWNEWAEGAHLEPDMAFGHRWLEALERAYRGARARPRRVCAS